LQGYIERSSPDCMNNKWYILFGSLLCARFSIAQTKQITTDDQVWVGYVNQTRLTDKWGILGDANLRTKRDFFTNFYHAIARAGVMYYLNDATRVAAGYAYVNNFPDIGHKDVSQPEHRPWQQIQWQTTAGKKSIAQRFRLEERFRRKVLNDSTLAPGYVFNFRARYQFSMQFPLSWKGIAPHTFSILANDEVMINFGKTIVYNYFDQNRFFVGLAYQTDANSHIQAGYMNVFQQLSSGYQARYSNIIRLFYYHNIDTRRKK